MYRFRLLWERLPGFEERFGGGRGLLLALAAIVAFAFYQRIAAMGIYGFPDFYSWADQYYQGVTARIYWSLSGRLLDSGTFLSIGYPPGYPIFLAALRWISGDSATFIRVFQITLDSLAVLPVFYILSRLGAPTIFAFFGAALYASHLSFVFGVTTLYGEALAPAFVAFELALLLKILMDVESKWWLSALLGGLIGAHIMFRPDYILFPGALIAIALVRFGFTASLLRIVPALVVIGGIVLSWGYHNKSTHDRWMFTTTSGGVALYEGLGEIGNPYGFKASDVHWNDYLRSKGMSWHSFEADDHMKMLFKEAVFEHPLYYLKTVLHRVHNTLMRADHQRPKGIGYPLLRLFANLGVVFLIAVAWRERKLPWIPFLIALPALYGAFSMGISHWEPRYARYVQVSYVLALPLALYALWEWAGENKKNVARNLRKSLIALTLFLLIYSALSWTVLVGKRAVEVLAQSEALSLPWVG